METCMTAWTDKSFLDGSDGILQNAVVRQKKPQYQRLLNISLTLMNVDTN